MAGRLDEPDGYLRRPKVHYASRKEMVADRLKQAILDGQYVEGELLPGENSLAKMFGVSRTTVREAVRILEAQSLVQVSAGIGVTVSRKSLDGLRNSVLLMLRREQAKVEDLFEIRSVLEPEAARLAAQRADETHVEKMRHLLRQFNEVVTDDQGAEVDIAFHLTIAAASDNPVLAVFIEGVRDLLRESIRLTQRNSEPMNHEDRLRLHTAIFEAIENRDAAAAQEAMVRHLAVTKKRLQL